MQLCNSAQRQQKVQARRASHTLCGNQLHLLCAFTSQAQPAAFLAQREHDCPNPRSESRSQQHASDAWKGICRTHLCERALSFTTTLNPKCDSKVQKPKRVSCSASFQDLRSALCSTVHGCALFSRNSKNVGVDNVVRGSRLSSNGLPLLQAECKNNAVASRDCKGGGALGKLALRSRSTQGPISPHAHAACSAESNIEPMANTAKSRACD